MTRSSFFCLLLLGAFANSTVTAQDFKLYFGLMHGHTSLSDGSGTPDEAFDMAKQAGLDFFAGTEHNHKQAAGRDGVFLTPENYGQLIASARSKTVPDEFLAIWGQEVSTISAGNHECIFFADQICDMPNGDFKHLYETFLPNHPEVPFIQFNHPAAAKDRSSSTDPNERNNDYGIDDYGGNFDALVAAAGQRTALIELVIGPAFAKATEEPLKHQQGKHEADYLFYLNKGFRLAPSAGQDNHFKTWGTATHARMGVWAKQLRVGDFIDAIQARRCFASEDNTASVWITANGSPMGSVIPLPSDAVVRLKIAVKDDDEPNAEYVVRLFYDETPGDNEIAQVIESQNLPASGELEFTHSADPRGYFFFKVTQSSESIEGVAGSGHADDIWTAPVWIGADGAVPLALAANTDDPEKTRIRWDEASDYVGNDVEVTGKLIRTFKFQDSAVFFNFDSDYENTLSLVILKSDFPAFGGEAEVVKLQQRLTNKNVLVKGKITLFRGERIQIRLTDPAQINEVAAEPSESDE